MGVDTAMPTTGVTRGPRGALSDRLYTRAVSAGGAQEWHKGVNPQIQAAPESPAPIRPHFTSTMHTPRRGMRKVSAA